MKPSFFISQFQDNEKLFRQPCMNLTNLKGEQIPQFNSQKAKSA